LLLIEGMIDDRIRNMIALVSIVTFRGFFRKNLSLLLELGDQTFGLYLPEGVKVEAFIPDFA
jgi:hypothetical protein